MEQSQLNVELRSKTGKGISRQLRMQGLIPGVVYGKGIESFPITLNAKELAKTIAGEGGHNRLITLKGDGGAIDGTTVIVADILSDPIRGNLMHVDFHKINFLEKVRVDVAVNLVGTALGIKEGGMLDFMMHSLSVECLPTQIPEHIDLDVTALAIGASVHAGDLKMPDGVKFLGDAMSSVVSIHGKVKEAEEVAPAEE